MKKKILMLITLLLVLFIVNDNVKAYTCEYGTFEDTDTDGFDTKITFNLDKSSKSITFDYNNSPEIKDSDVCSQAGSTLSSTTGSITDNGSDIRCSYYDSVGYGMVLEVTLGDTNRQENIDGIFAAEGNSCPHILRRYDSNNYPTQTKCYTFNDDGSTCDGMEDAQPSATYYEKSVNKEEIEKLNQENCFFYDIYKRELEKTLTNGNCEGNSDFTVAYQKFSSRCANYLSSHLYTSQEDGSDEYYANPCASKCAALKDTISGLCRFEDNDDGCGSLGARLLNWIYRMIKFVRYGVPALLIILSILDFIKAIASESDDEMKKVSARFAKRLIAAALIFIIPFILDFILRMFNIGLDAENPFCSQ